MSIVIIGGNECMERRYREACKKYGLKTKIFCKSAADIGNRIGDPDLLVLFTDTVSHKLVHNALGNVCDGTKVVRSHSSSLAALQTILKENVSVC